VHWRQNPQRVAWIILITSFCACCVLSVAVPLGIRGLVLHATRPRTAYVAATVGTAQLLAPGADDPTAVTERRAVAEGSLVITDDTARALLAISADEAGEQVLATVQLFQNTAVSLKRARTPRFIWSKDSDRITLDLKRGRIAVATQNASSRPIRVRLTTPQASVSFGAGTFDITIEGDETQVRARSGTADVLAAGTQVTAGSGERVSVPAGRPPNLPVPGAFNLVLDGTFSGDNLAPSWHKVVHVAEGYQPGQVAVEMEGQRRVVRFSRRTEDGAHNEAGIQQDLNRDVQGYDSLVLRLDLKLLYQSVPGGGVLASEYPVMVKILYTDIYGKDLEWVQGFYYLDLPPGSTWVRPTGDQIPLGIWYTYESPNLFDLLQDTRPAHINAIIISASGHDYDSMISDVALSVR